MNNTQTFSQLTKEQKEAVGLLSIGTFLEYFDLMLYVHMAVLLNEQFFPKTDSHTAALIAAFAFCSTYLFRPIGALIFGYIGDNIGRKATVMITTFMMSISCIIMANLPTYAQIGITAAYIVTACRIIQSMSSTGELIGAELYLTEITKPPIRYPIVASISSASIFGGMMALVVASFAVSQVFDWRTAFWIGAGVALVGAIARTTLRETPEFADAKRRIKQMFEQLNQDPRILDDNSIYQEKVNKKTTLAYFLILCSSTVSFYVAFIYYPQILKNIHGYTPAQVIHQNLVVSITGFLSGLLLVLLSYKIYPLKVLTMKLYFSIFLALACPYILYYCNTPWSILLLQLCFASFWLSGFPAMPILFKHFPILKRFTYSGLFYALSRASMNIITAFGIVYLVEYFNYWGLWIILIPVIIGYWFGLSHFIKLEKEAGNYPQ